MFGNKKKKKQEATDKTEIKEDESGSVIVHVMPKRFIAKQPAAHKARGTGIMILLTGAVILVVAGIALYFYYTNPKQLLNTNNTGSGAAPAVNEEQGGGAAAGNEDNSGQSPLAENTGNQAGENGIIGNTDGGDAGNTSDENMATNNPNTIVVQPEPDAVDIATGTTPAKEAATSTSAEATFTPPAAVYGAGTDSDGDGLTDAEEAILGSNINSPDSDGDGYTDLVEAMNLYNPAGTGALLANDNIEKYVNGDYHYNLLYPRAWIAEKAGGGDSVVFTLSSDEFIQVIVQPNPNGQSIESWYKEQLGKDFIKSGQTIYKNGWTGIRSEDGLIDYLTKPGGDNVFVLSYNPGGSGVLSYNNIFAIMVKSLEVSQ